MDVRFRRTNLTFLALPLACRSPHFTILKRLNLTDHYYARSPEGSRAPCARSRTVPEFLRLEVIQETMNSLLPLLAHFPPSLSIPTLILLDCAIVLSRQFFRRNGNTLHFLLVHIDIEVGGIAGAQRFFHVHPPCSSMYSTSLHEVHRWIFDEISKFHGGIDVRRHLGRKYHSKAELRKWTRKPIR